MFLARVERFAVIADASATLRTFGGTVAEDVFAGLPVVADNIGLAPPISPFTERPQLFRMSFEPPLSLSPRETTMAMHVFLEPHLQGF